MFQPMSHHSTPIPISIQERFFCAPFLDRHISRVGVMDGARDGGLASGYNISYAWQVNDVVQTWFIVPVV